MTINYPECVCIYHETSRINLMLQCGYFLIYRVAQTHVTLCMQQQTGRVKWLLRLSVCNMITNKQGGPGGSDGIATGYGLDGPGIKSR
jgi:hypothetical protein